MAQLSELIAFLEARLELPPESEKDVPLLWRPGQRGHDLRRVGLALEFVPTMERSAAKCDALFLHRPFRFPGSALFGVPVLASHVGFDAHLTTGFNPALAGALRLRDIKPLFRPDRPDETVPIGMVGTLSAPSPLSTLQERIAEEFGGLDETTAADDAVLVQRVAVMNALNPNLIALAAAEGATAYLTGQMRENARAAAQTQGVSVFAAGHERIEQWGLRRLSQEIRQALSGVETLVIQA